MRTRPTLLLAMTLLLAGCAHGVPQGPATQPTDVTPIDPRVTRVFTVDPARSTVSYTVTEHVPTITQFHPAIGAFRVTGRAPVRGGTIYLTRVPGSSSVRRVTVDPLQLKTDQGFRDRNIDPMLAGSALAQFDSTALSGVPATIPDGQPVRFQMTGRMRIADTLKPLTFDVTATLSGGTLTATATTKFDMTIFGVTPPTGPASNVDPEVTLEVRLVAIWT